MTTIKKTISATLLAVLTTPAFGAAHLDINSMTCEQYNELNGADRDKVATMAIAELNDNVQPTDGTATATESSVGSAAEESVSASTTAANDGTATATSTVAAGDHKSRFAEEIAVLNRTCSRNWDAMVKDAAAGQSGTR